MIISIIIIITIMYMILLSLALVLCPREPLILMRQTLKLTEVTTSDKLESFPAVKEVLKGHIALGNARFPNGTNGNALDILARVPLWKNSLDYRHGTGPNGIGSYLNVHEGPHLISFRPHARNVPLQIVDFKFLFRWSSNCGLQISCFRTSLL
ncbi:probable Xaa-Pro aminopeptidase P isoform X3 [Ziziphus jujuba]|uniref:Probable Xaa-Pro aminopeptidase P isoform X3 n=1 Tax=Ziziphus jujuba TaxID=326968 RepID=A0ABM3ZY69_ZIZJJ|nr:probable Xaa-Pro aminopeptidase P isoform X3 [Ziziphus jujuba]